MTKNNKQKPSSKANNTGQKSLNRPPATVKPPANPTPAPPTPKKGSTGASKNPPPDKGVKPPKKPTPSPPKRK